MNKVFAVLAMALASVGIAKAANGFDPVDYVNPLVGTQSTFELSTGNTYPAIARPWGMNFWMPQTGKMGDGWAYMYTANKIRGFKQTHQPSPWINDYGQFSIMPVTTGPEFDQDKRASWFSHKTEVAKPYYYKVYLADHDVVTELTTTDRAAMFRFTFPEAKESFVVLDAFDMGSFVKIIPEENKIVGYSTKNSGGVPANFKNYFVITFDKPIELTYTFGDSILNNDLERKANHVGAVVGFKTKRGELVHAKVASSFISIDQAELNLKELGNNSFDQLVAASKEEWNKTLGRIEVEGGTVDQFRTFYTTMYRSLLFPRKFYEYDAKGNIVHYSPYNGEVLPGYMFTDTGFWDTFRALFPFLNLMYPSVNKEIQEGLINAYKESGFFPEWASPGHRGCMVGNNSASILVDAYLKGVKVDDVKTMYEGMVHGANNVHPEVSSTGRLGHEYYNKLGYIPSDVKIHENAARTLEYAYNDWCIYQLAKELKRPKKEIELYKKRAYNYKNLFNKDFNLMSGRKSDGTFDPNFSPLKWGGDFTEGNSWHYSWSVFHDPAGLIEFMGGRKMFVQMLDSVFGVPPHFDDSYYGFVIHEIREMQIMNMGNYAHGNQPIQHMIYLYNYAGEPWKAQYWVREVMNKMYNANPDGYCGDEDNGQTSAWYVFSALGFYPVTPGSDQYVMGAPLFKKATITLENGNKIIINAPNNSDKNRYVNRVTVNGKEYSKTYYGHFDLMKGAVIDIDMTDTPNKTRGIKPEDAPYSFSVNEK